MQEVNQQWFQSEFIKANVNKVSHSSPTFIPPPYVCQTLCMFSCTWHSFLLSRDWPIVHGIRQWLLTCIHIPAKVTALPQEGASALASCHMALGQLPVCLHCQLPSSCSHCCDPKLQKLPGTIPSLLMLAPLLACMLAVLTPACMPCGRVVSSCSQE